MNHLLVLDDKTKRSRQGFVIVKRDFFLGKNDKEEDIVVDLAFRCQDKPYEDDIFYSIPVLSYPDFNKGNKTKNKLRLYGLCAEIGSIRNKSGLVGKSRFLVKLEGCDKPKLVEAEYRGYECPSLHTKIRGLESWNSNSSGYWNTQYSKLNQVDPDLCERIRKVESEFELSSMASNMMRRDYSKEPSLN